MIGKLIRRFIEGKQITVDDCDQLLAYYDYKLHKQGGSHRVYHKKGALPIVIIVPKHTKYIKKEYIDKLVKIFNLGV